jgi:hypothetical protein
MTQSITTQNLTASAACFKRISHVFTGIIVMLVFGAAPVVTQTQVIHHSFGPVTARSAGNSSLVTSLLGQTVFGVSRSNGISVMTGYAAYSKGVLSGNIRKNETLPLEYTLSQNFPNPFNPSTTIRYGLPALSRVSITIYNILGQRIAEIFNGEQTAGTYEILWNNGTASGLYFYRITAVNVSDPKRKFTQVKKMLALH